MNGYLMHKRGKMDKRKTHSTVCIRARDEQQRTKTDSPASLPEKATGEVLHELRVHQRKLEGQNEKLRMALVALDALRARYSNFFEMAPLGCVALDEEGMIQEANLRASTMLAIPRVTLNDTPLSEFIVEEDQNGYHLFRSALFDTGEPQACELRMKQHDGTQLWVRLEATVVKNRNTGARICLATISDITKPRNLQADLVRTDLMARMDVLAGDVAHEINTPLTFVLHNLERLLEELPTLTDILGTFRHASREPVGVENIGGESAALVNPTALAGLTDRARQMREGMLRIKEIVWGLSTYSYMEQESLSRIGLNHVMEHDHRVDSQ